MNKFLDNKLIHLCLEIEYYMKVAKGRRFQNVSVKDCLQVCPALRLATFILFLPDTSAKET